MKTYLVTVQKLMFEGDKVWRTLKYSIIAHNEDEARAIVHNAMELHEEPRFRIASVEEIYTDELL